MGSLPACGELLHLADRIRDLIADGKASLEADDADQWKVLALTRFQIMRALDAFNAFKEQRILPPLCCGGDTRLAILAERMRQRNRDLRDDYDAFIKRWEMTSPTSVGDFYKIDAHWMITRIEDQIAEDVRTVNDLTASA